MICAASTETMLDVKGSVRVIRMCDVFVKSSQNLEDYQSPGVPAKTKRNPEDHLLEFRPVRAEDASSSVLLPPGKIT